MTADEKEACRLAARPDLINYIGDMARIGVWSFITFLEYRQYPPGTMLNQSFHLTLTAWEGLRFAVVSIPRNRSREAEALMQTLGLRAADGIPTMLVGGEISDIAATMGAIRTGGAVPGVRRFPNFNTATCFTLEYSKPGHFAYQNDRALNKTAHDFEREAVEREVETFNRKGMGKR